MFWVCFVVLCDAMLKEERAKWLREKSAKRFAKKLRKRMTEEEILLWEALRNRKQYNLKIRRQVPIGPYIVDFLW